MEECQADLDPRLVIVRALRAQMGEATYCQILDPPTASEYGPILKESIREIEIAEMAIAVESIPGVWWEDQWGHVDLDDVAGARRRVE